MRSFMKSLFGVLIRLTVVPLSLPGVFATFGCCSVTLASPREAHSQCPEAGLVLSLGPQNAIGHDGVRGCACNGLVVRNTEIPSRCGCCPINLDAKRPMVVRRSAEIRTKLVRGIHSTLPTASTLSSSNAVDFLSAASAWAASGPTSAEKCVLHCRLLL